jgi:ectoine hydroxylase-related dioxygenase (phytanoyl-CoA dioxygenase family)
MVIGTQKLSGPANPVLFRQYGFQSIQNLVPPEMCDLLAVELSALMDQRSGHSRYKAGGVRNLLRLSPNVAELAKAESITAFLGELAGMPCFPVRAIYFDKTADANWSVPWHQDLAIAVAERIETPGFGSWSVKDGIPHTQPPMRVLEKMLTVRLHLDDCDANNGALKVIPNSHMRGELSAKAIAAITGAMHPFVCELPKGGALVMRPLLLHASSRSRNPDHRRVLHIEYATEELPNDLKWFDHR